MTTVTFDAVSALVRANYEKIWKDWYCYIPGASRAIIEIWKRDCSAAYSHSRNLMLIPIPEGNLEDSDILDEDDWPIWKIDLIHEMLHEWQNKKPSLPSQTAAALYARHGTTSCGERHGPDFFQAILEKAPYFEMTAERLIELIR